MNEIKAITMPGIHMHFLRFFKRFNFDKNLRVLDLGAGHGAFSKVLYEMGYNVSACDFFPEQFHFKQVECVKADITKKLPFADNSFDIVVAIEVIEHIIDHEIFFSEVSRVLTTKGHLLISTPNILSLKSRIKFLLTGFFYSFKPLELKNYDGLQHVNSKTINQYNYTAVKNGFLEAKYDIDQNQSTSKWLLLLYPAIWISNQINHNVSTHNQIKILLGRLLFLDFKNDKYNNTKCS
jgi:2-polyprenyl-3-methyl-5-hydroxy-6-metoxy-1,4-benzoquinol methylase